MSNLVQILAVGKGDFLGCSVPLFVNPRISLYNLVQVQPLPRSLSDFSEALVKIQRSLCSCRHALCEVPCSEKWAREYRVEITRGKCLCGEVSLLFPFVTRG